MNTPNNWDKTIDLILCVAANYGLIIPDDELEEFQQGFKHTKGFKEIKSALNKAVSEIVIGEAHRVHCAVCGAEALPKSICSSVLCLVTSAKNELQDEQRKIIGDK